MNKYARDIQAIREADASKAILTCHDEYLLASMVQGVDGALVGFATFIPQLIIDLWNAVKAGDLKKAQAVQAVITPLKDAVYGGGEPTGEAHARMKGGMYLAGVLDAPTVRPPTEAPNERKKWPPCARPCSRPACWSADPDFQSTTSMASQHPQGDKPMQRRPFLRTLATAALLGSLATGAFAQAYPSPDGEVHHPFPPGGTLDTVGRMLAQKLSEQMGQTFIVENKRRGQRHHRRRCGGQGQRPTATPCCSTPPPSPPRP